MKMNMEYECIECGKTYDISRKLYTCPECGGLLEIELDLEEAKEKIGGGFKGGNLTAWKYRPLLPVEDESKIVSLDEGGTPLYSCDKLADWVGVDDLHVKFEAGNPTGSFKDRGMTVGLTKAKEYGVDTVTCASTGNTSAALAAYSAKSDLDCVVLVPSGNVALGKIAQAIMHGARILSIDDNFDKALEIVRRLCEEREDIYLLNSEPVQAPGSEDDRVRDFGSIRFRVSGQDNHPYG